MRPTSIPVVYILTLTITSAFQGLLHLQFLIACSMERKWIRVEGLGMRLPNPGLQHQQVLSLASLKRMSICTVPLHCPVCVAYSRDGRLGHALTVWHLINQQVP